MYAYLVRLITLTTTILLMIAGQSQAQTCGSAQGNQTSYGTNNVWIGYVYTGQTLATANYQGFVNEGNSSNPNFNETISNSATYGTNGCTINTTNFSVRYKLNQTFNGNYTITVGGDDGYRFSTDGGSTWTINNWSDHGYQTTAITVNLSGNYNFILEFYQNGGAAQVSFNMVLNCSGSGSQTTYGTNNVWIGYIYQGMNFQTYKGSVTEGSSASPFFDENFGNPSGSNTNTFNTNTCAVTTYQFSAIYMLQQTYTHSGNVTFTVGGDDGFRFSIDGGNTWVINKWNDQSYTTATYSTWLNAGTYNTVLEYYQNGGYNRITYNNTFVTLPVTVTNWAATLQSGDKAQLNWTTTNAVNFDHFIIQRSTDEENFDDIATVNAKGDSLGAQQYAYTDQFTYNGNVYYRLKMVDRDGIASYTKVVELPMEEASTGIKIFPTLVTNGQLTVDAPKAVNQARLELYDMNGRKMLAQDWASLQGRQQVSLTGNGHLAAGAYIVRLTDNQTVLAKQIIIIK